MEWHDRRVTDAPQYRIGNSERDAALTALGNHMRAGRLTPDEYSVRASQVADARTGIDLGAVFSDLPGGTVGVLEVQPASAVASAAMPLPQPRGNSFNWVAVAGPLSFALFMICGLAIEGGFRWSWLFFMLPALIGAARRGRRD